MDDAEAVAAFFRAVWTNGATAEAVHRGRAEAARRNPAQPGADVPTVVYLRDGSVIGYLTTVPVTFWNGATEIPGHWLKGFMVLPEHRNGPVGFAVLKEMLRHLNVSGNMTVGQPARRLFKAVGYTDCGAVPNYVSLLRPGRVARSIDIGALGLGLPGLLDRAARASQKIGLAWLGGASLGIGLRAWRLARGTTWGYRVDSSGSPPTTAEADALWLDVRPTLRAGAVRNAAFLSWRYNSRPGALYEAVCVRRAGSGALAAVAIVRRPSAAGDHRLRGIKVATLSDILYRCDEPEAGVAALAGAERVARRMGADAMLCTAQHPAISAALHRRAYVRLPGNVHLMIRDQQRVADLPAELDAWWLTRGDADADGVF